MRAWPRPPVPDVPGSGLPPRVFDTARDELVELPPDGTARMYVCGITPYDATHLGHAATYVTFDLLVRLWRDAARPVRYVQNVTDVDEPLLQRAERDKVAWQDLAADEIDLFRRDMAALNVIPPEHYVGAVEGVPADVTAIEQLLASGAGYRLAVPDGPGDDVYLDLATQPSFGTVCSWTREEMLEVFADRGGDPDREGKRDVLDPLLWRAERPGEPAWDGASLGPGRPGWHIECTTIALEHLGMGFDVQGGGDDLIFPHHEMSAVQAVALEDKEPFARAYVHQAMVGLDGEKMSKSKGNLVLVSGLREDGVDPMAIRLTLLDRHYRGAWDYTPDLLEAAQDRLRRWRQAVQVPPDTGVAGVDATTAEPMVAEVRRRLADDLDSPGAVRAVDTWADGVLAAGAAPRQDTELAAGAVDALLGIRL